LDTSIIYEIFAIIILLGFSAFFSGSESAFFSIPYIMCQRFKHEKKDKVYLKIAHLLESPNKLLITILLGNLIVNVLISAIGAAALIQISKELNLSDVIGASVSTILISIILLLCGEITPKLIAVSEPVKFARRTAGLLSFFILLLRPITIIFQYLTDYITNKLIKTDINRITDKDFDSIVKVGHSKGIIDKKEKEILEHAIGGMKKEVQEIMIPRARVTFINAETGIKEIISQIKKSKFKVLPVYKEIRDNIIGCDNRKDILPYIIKTNGRKSIREIKEILRPVKFVPAGKKIYDLLVELQKEKQDFSVVVNEYGTVLGVVTLDDIIEAIFGEYKEEYEPVVFNYRRIGKNRYIIRGDMKIGEFNKIFHARLSSVEAETVSGVILEKIEKIPQKGEKILIDRFLFTVSRTKGPRIETLIVEKAY